MSTMTVPQGAKNDAALPDSLVGMLIGLVHGVQLQTPSEGR